MKKQLIFESKFNNLFNHIMICEDRKENLDYEEKKAKGVITTISVKVTGSSADKINRLVEGIEQNRDLIDEYTAKCKELTAEAKAYSTEFFDEADKVYSRVIESNKAIITFSKVVPKLEKKEVKDYKKLEELVGQIADLIKEQQDETAKQIKDLIENCQWISEKEELKVPPEKVTTKSIVTEGVKDIVKKLKEKITSWINDLKEFFNKFDTRQQKIEELFAEIDNF